MLKAIGGALFVSWLAWLVMRSTGTAGPDAGLYGDVLRDAWGVVVGVARWVVGVPEYPQRAVLIVAAVVGGLCASKL